ncbi:hypothetical protein AA0Y32_10195 [Georgenia phoenicis]
MPDQVNELPANTAAPRWQVGVMAQQAALQARLREIIGADRDGGEHL